MSEISRRVTLAWVAAAAAGPWAISSAEAAPDLPATWPQADLPPITLGGYGQDPNLVKPVVPWPLTLSPQQRGNLRTIAGLMLPADVHSPSAATMSIDAFIDEWVSAPYPQQQRDRGVILHGMEWLDAESQARFQHDFATASEAEHRAIFDDIAFRGRVKPGYERPALFFGRLRALVLAGFYSLPEGFSDIGYIGNTPSLEPYPGPPKDAVAHLNAALTKLGLKTVS
ncbi:MAG: Tat pathway signal protein [Alphaproteobacteria bacterium]|nr:Tat pathway signal protein [Alphaproteobacteria bacterium]MDB5741281.1 Tat pathway signal protein [Alphaproteobacteria bacterium]